MPSEYSCALKALPQLNFSSPRELPVWRFFRILHLYSTQPPQKKRFLSRVQAFRFIVPKRSRPVSAEQQAETSQRYYCNKQRQNDKTRRVLESLGSDWAEHYMTTVLFDLPETSGLEKSFM